MVEYKVEKVAGITVTFLQRFEEELKGYLTNLIGTHNCGLSIKWALLLTEERGKLSSVWELRTNANFSLTDSLTLQEEVHNYLKRKDKELSACLPSKQLLIIDLIFESKDVLQEDNKTPAVTQDYFIPRQPKYKMESVILEPYIKNEIEEAINIIRYQHLIYEEWGFTEIDPYSKSVLNFYGPSGTGKTMTADAIAHSLGKSILAMNYAEIESKYVGDAAKNLSRAFESAKKFDAVLFFDEADSFLGKRIQNVSQGADQALNSLRSQMLILLENFNGIVIFATNLISNFDSAFESRILKHIKFELPNHEARSNILRGLIPTKLPLEMPLSNEEFNEMSGITEGLSGRELKGAILEVLLHKASESGEKSIFCFSDFKEGLNKKVESLKKLKEAKKSEKEKKILKALKEMPKEELIQSNPNSEQVENGYS